VSGTGNSAPQPSIGRKRIPVACTLTDNAAVNQAHEWGQLRRHAESVELLEAGVRMVLPAAIAAKAEDLAARERVCCAFLNITFEHGSDQLTIEITTEDPTAMPLLTDLAGITKRTSPDS